MQSKPIIALTFDDGPSMYTTRILDSLQQHGGRVSFFVLGSKIEEHKGKIYRAAQMDCEIICHAWDHVDLTQLSKRAVNKQIVDTITAIAKITGTVSLTFRPPYGQVNEKVHKIAKNLGLAIVNWSLDPKDSYVETATADSVYNYIIDNIKDGDIVLCHDIRESTSAAMDRLIPELISRDYQLVTVTELMEKKYGKPEPGRLYPKLIKE